MSNILTARGVTKSYNGVLAVNSVNLEIKQGEIFGLIGESGAGKTTTIKILTSQIKADQGEVELLEKSISNWKRRDLPKIGVMTDDFGLYTRLTCYENLRLYEMLYHLPIGYAMALLSDVGLENAAHKKVGDLSKGMKQRLAFVRSIINSPQVLFLDEPTSDLDPVTTERIHLIIENLKANGTTILLTTHDMSEATKLCDRIGILMGGRLVLEGNPQQICRKYDMNKQINIVDNSGKQHIYKNNAMDAKKICNHFENNNVASIHSSEPSLNELFISLAKENEKE